MNLIFNVFFHYRYKNKTIVVTFMLFKIMS